MDTLKAASFVMLCALAGCVSRESTQQSFCSAARPIWFNKADKVTLETERLIIGHNEIGQRLCDWQAPKK